MGLRTCLLVEDRVDRILVQRHPQTLKFLADRPSDLLYQVEIKVVLPRGVTGDHAWMSCCSAILICDLEDVNWDVKFLLC